MSTPLAIKAPGALMLTRARDRLSFLYLDRCRIERDDNGVHARIELPTPEDMPAGFVSMTTYIPTAALSSLLLGPGTSITQPAAAACAQSGCGVVFVGSGVVRSYAAFLSPYAPTHLLEAQARLFADDEKRTQVARDALRLRFPDIAYNATAQLSLPQLRGLEGARVKAEYQSQARRYQLKGWRRNTGSLGPLDPVNEALNYANTALYGVVGAVVMSLGLSAGLGFTHAGNRKSFVLDIADLYKTEVTVPLAFSLHNSDDPGADAMRALRTNFKLLRLLPRIVDDIYRLLGVDQGEDDEEEWSVNTLSLWDDGRYVRSGINHGRHLRLPPELSP